VHVRFTLRTALFPPRNQIFVPKVSRPQLYVTFISDSNVASDSSARAIFLHGPCRGRPPYNRYRPPIRVLGRFDATNRSSRIPNVNLYLLYKTAFCSILHTVFFTGDLCSKSWISTRFEVLDRFRNYVFQRRHLRQPQKLFRFRRPVS